MTMLAPAPQNRATQRRRGRSFPARSGAIACVLASLAASAGLVSAFQPLAADEPSPATGHAQVVAQGVAALPAPELAWRVVLDTAEALDQAATQDRALGFALADRAALVVDDAASGVQTRLAPGEALFVAGGARQRRASLDGADAPYYRLGLVPAADAGDAGGDRLVFSGDPFLAPSGRAFDLDLVRDVLGPNEESTLPASDGQTLVLATAGTIEVEAGEAGSSPIRLAAGQAASVAGRLSLFGVGDRGGTFVAALIGPEVPAPPTPPTQTPTQTPASGTITLRVLGCPAGVAPEDLTDSSVAGASCGPVALDPAPTLTLAGNQPLSPDRPDPTTGTYTWTSLISGPFPLGRPTLPRGYDRSLFVAAGGVVVDPPVFDVGTAPFDVSATLYLIRGETASLTLGFFACPAGMTRDTLAGDFCEASGGDYAVEIASLDGSVLLRRDDAEETIGPFLTWPDLPPGRYAVRVTDLPSSYDDYLIPVALYDPTADAYLIDVGGEAPAAEFGAYFLQAAPAERGSITVRVFACPPGMGRDDLVGDVCQAAAGFDLRLSLPDGRTLGPADANVGGNVATWTDLPPGDYYVEETILPAGFTDAYAPGAETSGLNPTAYLVRVGPDALAADLALYNLRPNGDGQDPSPLPSQAASETDSDSDGLADAAEPGIGTDPTNPDTDGDGRADGDEIGPRRVVTDPLDPDSDDDGVDDGDEIGSGTDPNDPAST